MDAVELGRSRRGGRAQIGALDLPRLVALEHVALFDVVEVVEQDPALEALLDLAHVVLDAAKRADRGLVDDGSLADDANLRATPDDAARDHAAGDVAEPRCAEDRAHLGLAERLLGLDRLEHADERLLDVLGQLVDDAVGADLNTLALRERARLGAWANVEADDQRVRRAREVDVVLGDPADTLEDDVHAHLGVLDLLQLRDRGFDRADDVALEDQVQILDAAAAELFEQRLEGDRRGTPLGELLAAQPLAAGVRELARAALVLDDACRLAGGRRLVEAQDLDRRARRRLAELLAAEVVQSANARPRVARHDRVADLP